MEDLNARVRDAKAAGESCLFVETAALEDALSAASGPGRRERIAAQCLAGLLSDSVNISKITGIAEKAGLDFGTVAARSALGAADSLIAEIDRAR
jgi:hypothetical protein